MEVMQRVSTQKKEHEKTYTHQEQIRPKQPRDAVSKRSCISVQICKATAEQAPTEEGLWEAEALERRKKKAK